MTMVWLGILLVIVVILGIISFVPETFQNSITGFYIYPGAISIFYAAILAVILVIFSGFLLLSSLR